MGGKRKRTVLERLFVRLVGDPQKVVWSPGRIYGWRMLLLIVLVEPKSDGDGARWRLCGGYKIVYQ